MFPIIICRKKIGGMPTIDLMKYSIEKYFIQELNKRKVDKNKEVVQELIFLQQQLMYRHLKIIQLILKRIP